MPIKTRGGGIPLRGGGGSSGGSVTVNDHSGEPISTGVRTIEWQTLDQFGFTVNVDPDDNTKVVVGKAPVFADPVVWSSERTTKVRVSSSDTNEPDSYITNSYDGETVDGTTDNFVYSTTVGRGFGDDARLSVKVLHGMNLADDHTFTCNSNGTQTQGNVTVTIFNYEADGDGSAFKARLTVTVDTIGVIGSTNSGMCRVELGFTEHKWGERRNLNQDIFKDKNPNTPSISGTPSFSQVTDPALRLTKFISGIQYYTLGNPFDISVPSIDNHNEDTSKPSGSLSLDSEDLGITSYVSSPWVESSNWSGYTDFDTVQGIDYQEDRAIDKNNYRHIGTAKVINTVSDSWGSSSPVNTNSETLCIDTVTNPSTPSTEYFDEENYRLDNDYSSSWDSSSYCIDGEAIVFGGALYHGSDLPRILRNSEGAIGSLGSLSSSFPNEASDGSPRGNPNYTGHSRDAVFIRKFFTPSTTVSYPTMSLNVLTNVDLKSALDSGDLEIYLWKIDSIDNTTPNTTLPTNHNPTNPRGTLEGSIWVHRTC